MKKIVLVVSLLMGVFACSSKEPKPLTLTEEIVRENRQKIEGFVGNKNLKGLKTLKAHLQKEVEYCQVETPPPEVQEDYFANCSASEEILKKHIPEAELKLQAN